MMQKKKKGLKMQLKKENTVKNNPGDHLSDQARKAFLMYMNLPERQF